VYDFDMKLTDSQSVPWQNEEPIGFSLPRSYRLLLQAIDQNPGNFALQLLSIQAGDKRPACKRNYDQILFQLSGDLSLGKNIVLKPGMIAYIPEGQTWGPERQRLDGLTLWLQFGADSRSGYLPPGAFRNQVKLLAKIGAFSEGFFSSSAVGDRDAYELAWEIHFKRPYASPIAGFKGIEIVRPEDQPWALGVGKGLATRHLGIFSDTGTAIHSWMVQENAQFTLQPHTIYWIEQGRGRVGRVGYKEFQAIYVSEQEKLPTLSPSRRTLLLAFTLPRLLGGFGN
jgi:hypothetical protein